MPQIVSCPDCNRKLRVPDDLLGKKVKCPGCGQKFLAEPAEAPEDARPRAAVTARLDEPPPPRRHADEDDAPKSRRRRDEEEDEDYPASRRRDDDDEDRRGGPIASKADVRQGWERVRFGVNLVIIATWVLVGTVGTAVAGWLMLILFGVASFGSIAGGMGAGGPPNQQAVKNAAGQAAGTGAALLVGGCLLWGLVILLLLAYAVLRITGIGFFMGVAPTRKTQHLKYLAIATFCLALAGILLPVLFVSFQFALASARVGGCIGFSGQGLSAVIGLAEFICFFLFLRGVAVALKKDGLAQNVLIYMISVPIYWALAVVSVIIFVVATGAAMFGALSSSAGSNNPSVAAGNVAGAGAAMIIAGITCWGLLALIGLALFVWYVVLLYQVRGALDRWLDRN
jgi:hypothetical protein